jgi:hypothetical protein
MQHRLRQEAEKDRSSEEWNNLLAELEVARYSMLAQQLRGVEKDSSSGPEQKVVIGAEKLRAGVAVLSHRSRGGFCSGG